MKNFGHLILIFAFSHLIFKQRYLPYNYNLTQMDITIDFTHQDKPKLSQLTQHPYLRSVTFVLDFFKESSHNFSCLWEFITYLNDQPLVKIFVKPKGQIKPKYKTVAVGGTFDHLHIGHQVLLLHAVLSTEKKLIVGVTSQTMLQKKANKQIIQSYLMRINEVSEFIKKCNHNIEIEFVELHDPYGPTITSKDIDAIAITPETLRIADTINQKRKQLNFPPLVIQTCPLLVPVHHLTSLKPIENKISSTQIRAHILAKNGLTIEKFTKYQGVWLRMIERLNKLIGCSEQDNHLMSRKWWDIIVKYYSQYWRYYHTNHHVAAMFQDLEANKETMGFDKLSETDKLILEISIFFHDIIYRPDLKSNEEDSSLFVQYFLNQIWTIKQHAELKQDILHKVQHVILSTRNHHHTTQVEKILCDLDMAILDTPLEKYQTFAFNVQREYRPLYKENYPQARLDFLIKHQNGYPFSWRSGDRVKENIKWQIDHWTQQVKSQ